MGVIEKILRDGSSFSSENLGFEEAGFREREGEIFLGN